VKHEAVEVHICILDRLRSEIVMLHPFDIGPRVVDLDLSHHADVLHDEFEIPEGS